MASHFELFMGEAKHSTQKQLRTESWGIVISELLDDILLGEASQCSGKPQSRDHGQQAQRAGPCPSPGPEAPA